jgi:hypothetical protein
MQLGSHAVAALGATARHPDVQGKHANNLKKVGHEPRKKWDTFDHGPASFRASASRLPRVCLIRFARALLCLLDRIPTEDRHRASDSMKLVIPGRRVAASQESSNLGR